MAITRLMMSISGGRMAMRMIIWYAFCMFVTSVVRRVMRPAVEYLSMLENEYVWIVRRIVPKLKEFSSLEDWPFPGRSSACLFSAISSSRSAVFCQGAAWQVLRVAYYRFIQQ